MTIIQVGPYPLDASIIKGGVEASVYGLAQEQSKSHRVSVIDVPRINGEDRLDNDNDIQVFRFRNIGHHIQNASKRIKDIISIIRDINPDICHIHGTSIFSRKLYNELKKENRKVILTVHGLVIVEKMKKLKKHFSFKTFYQLLIQGYAERRLLSSVDHIIVDTEYVSKEIKAYRLKTPPSCSVIPQGINKAFYKLRCSKDSRIVLSVGSISPRKGHLLLVKSFNCIAKEFPDIRLVICGIMADESYYNELIKFISNLDCKERIGIFPNLPIDSIYKMYNQAHIFALHSQEESQGIVFAEAMAAGLPIAATRVGGIPYVVSEGKTGLLSEYGDIGSFSKALSTLLSSDSTWSQLSSNCLDAAPIYSWEFIANRVERLYSTL